MGIKLKTPQSVIDQAIENKVKAIKRSMLEGLEMIGLECVNLARHNGSYKDQSGNLRSSVGYLIVQDGKVMNEGGFEQVKGGKEGVETGKRAVREVAKEFPTHSVLIVVAGMNYGIYVERKGYDVLTQAKLYAKSEAKRLLKEAGLDV